MVDGVWKAGIWKTVASHMSLSTQDPKRATTIGSTEYPIPRRTPTSTSMIPQRKYVERIMLSLFIPAATTL